MSNVYKVYIAVMLRLLKTGAPVSIDGITFLVRKNHYQLRGSIRTGWQAVMSQLTTYVSSEDVFIDIGANIGIAALLVAKKTNCRVYAFEPVVSTYIDLCENIIRNPGLRVTPFNMAVSNSVGFVEMTNKRASGINRIIGADAEGREETFHKEGRILVPSITIDELFALYISMSDTKRLLIKIDVERHELEVLRGAGKLLEAKIPIMICLEYFSDDNARGIDCFFHDRGFALAAEFKGESDVFYKNAFWT